MSTLDKLKALGYDGAEIHYLYRFYGLHQVMVFDPSGTDFDKARRNLMKQKMDSLIGGGDKELIADVISLGRNGIDYQVAWMLSNKPKGL
jgi:hypothetical protein